MSERYFVSDEATVGAGCTIGVNAFVEADTALGDGVVIGQGAVILSGTVLGDRVEVGPNCVLGKRPRAASSSTRDVEPAGALSIGDDCVLGASCVVYAGSSFSPRCYVGDQAGIRENCVFADEVLIGRMVSVEADVTVGARSRIMTGAYITGETTIEEDVFVGPMVVTTNDRYITMWKEPTFIGPTLKRGATVGAGACLLSGITLGEGALIGMGAVVTKDVPPGRIFKGNPAADAGEVRRAR